MRLKFKLELEPSQSYGSGSSQIPRLRAAPASKPWIRLIPGWPTGRAQLLRAAPLLLGLPLQADLCRAWLCLPQCSRQGWPSYNIYRYLLAHFPFPQPTYWELLPYRYLLTINVPLFKKMRDIMVFLRDYYFWAISRDFLRGPRLFWPLKLSRALRCCALAMIIK